MSKNKTITLRVKQSTYEGLVKIAKENDISISQIVRMVIKETMKGEK